MTRALRDHERDRLLAVVVLVFAGSLLSAARGIDDSLLADAVGAGGVPQGVGIVMGLAALVLFAKSFVGHAGAAAAAADPAPAPWLPLPRLLRTAALVLILLGYGLLLPWLGYPLTVSLLVLAAGWLAGAALRLPLLLCAAAAGPALWAMFDGALQVHMPSGTLWAGL